MGAKRFTRIGFYGVCCAALIGTVAGCSNVRNQMPAKRFARPYTPPATQPIVMAPAVENDPFTSVAIDGLPAGVQASFLQDHPSAQITAVERIPSGSGPMLYRVAYLEDSVAGSSSYRSTGMDLAPPAAIVYRPDDGGRPRAKYAPHPEGGIPEKGTPTGAID